MVDNYEFWDPEKESYKEYKSRTKGKGMRGGVGKKKNNPKPEKSLGEIKKDALYRARYRCEWADCTESQWLELAHIVQIGYGGMNAKLKYDFENVCILCKYHHDIFDGRNTKGTKRAMNALVGEYMKLRWKK